MKKNECVKEKEIKNHKNKIIWKMFAISIALIVVSVGFLSGCNEQLPELGSITINGPTGTLITLPSDSPDSDVQFSIEELNISMVSYVPDWCDEVISLYNFSADRPLEESVTIKIPIPDVELAVFAHYHNWKWEVLTFKEENGKAVVEVDNFSWFSWNDVSSFTDKVLNFFTLRWLDKPEKLIYDSHIVVDESNTYDMITGSGQLIDDDTVELTILNNAPVHLEVWPIDLSKSYELKKTGIYTLFTDDYTIIPPRTSAKWKTELVIGESNTFNAYFSERAGVAFVGDLIPYGRLARGVSEGALFAKNGREMKWDDIKSLLIFPTFAEAGKIYKELKEMPDALLEIASIVFTRVESSEPSVTEKELIKEKLEQWLYDNRYSLSEFGGFGYAIDIGINDMEFLGSHIWAVGNYQALGGYGHIFHSVDKGDSWEVQWKSSTYGPDPFRVIFLDEFEGFIGADDAVLHTTDQGYSWNTIWKRPGLGGWLRDFDVIDRENLWCRTSSKSEFYLYTTDGGENWEVKYS